MHACSSRRQATAGPAAQQTSLTCMVRGPLTWTPCCMHQQAVPLACGTLPPLCNCHCDTEHIGCLRYLSINHVRKLWMYDSDDLHLLLLPTGTYVHEMMRALPSNCRPLRTASSHPPPRRCPLFSHLIDPLGSPLPPPLPQACMCRR
jgi:hypothetical protein